MWLKWVGPENLWTHNCPHFILLRAEEIEIEKRSASNLYQGAKSPFFFLFDTLKLFNFLSSSLVSLDPSLNNVWQLNFCSHRGGGDISNQPNLRNRNKLHVLNIDSDSKFAQFVNLVPCKCPFALSLVATKNCFHLEMCSMFILWLF